MLRFRALLVIGLVAVIAGYQARTVSQSLGAVTSPAQEFGAAIGDDYFLATYTQLEQYWKKLDAESDRVRLVSIGPTEEGREQWMAIVSAPGNIERLERYRTISRRLALGDASEAEARRLAAEGKAVVWIDGGLHADEVLGAQQLIDLSYELARSNDAETARVLQDVIVLVVHANPDGHALVADWYMRERDPLRRTLDGLPRAYHKYVGHDNNRDFFLSSQAETTNMNRVLYKEWLPQIVLDHHQPGPPGTVMFAPPFRGPFNYLIDPLVPSTLDRIGDAMQTRFAAEGKRGVTMRGGAGYSGWWNGGLRTSAYFHNQIGLLTEITGEPTPMQLPVVPERQVATADLPMPIAPQRWHFRQAMQYSMTANRAVLDYASKYRESLLLNAYTMARTAIAEGSRDSWMPAPGLRGTKQRAPRAYVVPAAQPDFPTATKFIDALLKAGVVVHRSRADFRANGVSYAAGSYVVRTAQPFRAHVLDMFEPQRYPDDQAPYDITGWTLALQMGVKFDRLFDAFEGPFDQVDQVEPPPSAIRGGGTAGFVLSHHQNDSAIAVNRLLRAGVPVYWLSDRSVGSSDGTGSIYVRPGDDARTVLATAARELGVTVSAADAVPAGGAFRLHPLRIALWDRYGGAATSGWIRWLLEQYEFPFDLVFVPDIDAGDLAEKYDVLILPDEAQLQRVDRTAVAVPGEYRHRAGVLTESRSVPALKRFAERGGTLVVIGQAARIVASMGVSTEPIPYNIPGSILRTRVDNTTPIGFGFEAEVDVFFDNNPVFRATGVGGTAVAQFERSALRSGWARGEDQLAGGLAAIDMPYGRGRMVVFGPQIAFRAQSHGTFKFLFNAIHYARAERRTLSAEFPFAE
jgi:hypothetical protein